MNRTGSMVLMCAGLFLALISGANPALAKDAGKALYDQSCKICHGADGRGDGPAAKAFRPPPTDFLDDSFWNEQADEAIVRSIQKGKGAMPSIRMSPEQIAKVVEYMNREFKGSVPAEP